MTILSILLPVKALSTETNEPLPERWQYAGEYAQPLPCDDSWWKKFNDQTLDSLIAMAVNNNYNVAAALHRIEAARQSVTQARAAYYPSVGIQGGWTKSRSAGAISGKNVPSSNTSYFNLGANASWEIDVFGRIKAKVKQSKAQYQATRAEYAGTMVSLCSDLANYYIKLRVLQQELFVVKEHIQIQDSVLGIVNARYEAGLNSKLDVAQARTIYYSTLASVPGLESQIKTTINAIALLLGDNSPQIKSMLEQPSPMPQYAQIINTGVPAELLRRRPDVVQAECSVAESAAALGIAKKDFLPTLALTGSIGTAAHRAGDLFSKNSFEYSIAPQLSWTVFDGFSRRSSVVQARELMQANIANYNNVVLTAYEEVNNAVINYVYALKNIDYLTQVVKEAEESLRLSVDLYRGGLSSFTNVADAEISFLQYADNLVTARGAALTALVNVYDALGGGWSQSN